MASKGLASPANTTAVYIGRFQPFHKGHLEAIRQARAIADRIIIVIGSSHAPRTIKNPFTYMDRAEMIMPCLRELNFTEWHIEPVTDHPYSNNDWVQEVQAQVTKHTHMMLDDVVLIGMNKDASSFYLKLFPQWFYHEVKPYVLMNATDLRNDYFGKGDPMVGLDRSLTDMVPLSTAQYLHTFVMTEEFKNLKAEHEFIQKYKKQWESAPYAPTFVTTDAVVLCNGHVLVVKRGAHPGKGLYAWPGGFLNQDETIKDSIVRELMEETKIKVPKGLLETGIKTIRVFDNPTRSLRGRTITHAGLIVLNVEGLPKVKGSDDAEHAQWIPINKFYNMSKFFFEDHWSIGTYLLGKAE